MKVERYRAYKNSGVQWLGEVPDHWQEKRVKDIAILERGKFTHRPRNDPQMYDGVHPFIQTGDVARAVKYVTSYKQTLSDRGTTVSKWFPKGTLVMAIAANIGDVAIVNFDTYFPDSIVAYKSKKCYVEYLFYLFSATRHELDKVKVTSTQDNLNLERLNSLIRFIPPLPEQKAIAHYLDTKTAQIDRKIDLLTQKAKLYGNLKQSLINETVTRGLDKSVRMSDRGVEWIGEVPEHWSLSRIKNLTKTKSGTTPQSGLSQYYDNGTHFWVRTTDLNNNKLYSSEFKVTDLAREHYNLASIPIRSILLAMYGGMGTIGKNAILQEEVTINQSVCAIFPNNKKFFSQYLWYYIQYFRPHWEIFADSARKDPNLNQEAIKRLWVTLPPLPEQKTLADYLDTKIAQIDQIIQTINTQIEKLKELRKTLINDVVTGKIKVTENL